MRTKGLAVLLFLFYISLLPGLSALRVLGLSPLKHTLCSKRSVTVSDAISMTKLGDPSYYLGGSSAGRVGSFSPDGKKFVVILRKGNLANNTNEFSLLIWKTADLFRQSTPAPELLLTMSSSSNREAIKDIVWLSDNETIAFLGEHPGEQQQLYIYDVVSHTLTRLTDHPTSLSAFSITPDGRAIAFAAEEVVGSMFDTDARQNGVVVSTQVLYQLIADRKGGTDWGDKQLFFRSGSGVARPIKLLGTIAGWNATPYLSPDGRYIVIPTYLNEVAEMWKSYLDPLLQEWMAQTLTEGQHSWIQEYEVIDTATGESRTLVNAPLAPNVSSEVAWSSDSHSVALAGLYLPLVGVEADELNVRRSNSFAIVVDVPGSDITKVSEDKDLTLDKWDAAGWLEFAAGRSSGNGELRQKVYFQQENGGHWTRIADVRLAVKQPDIMLEENMNTPPRIVAVDSSGHRRELLLDLNPQFKELRFARVEEVNWKATDGHVVKGGLYYPVDFVPGTRYPLVIQTHAWTPEKFWIDGPWTTAFAAQPLAGKNIMVLQIEAGSEMGKPIEAERETAAFEGAIDDLYKKGFIDRGRVGIIGFSRTCLHVKYALTHSKYNFAAASVTDGVDGGYMQYLINANSGPAFSQFYETINGGLPFGDDLKSWITRSPGFNIDKVHTPLRIVAENPTVTLFEWEWFVALRRLGRPVEMIMMQDGEHILQKPSERLVSQQGNVEWFAFWLRGDQDSDPAKREQYSRWRAMRDRR